MALLAPFGAGQVASATTAEFETELGVGRSTNFARSAITPQDATLKSAGLRFSLLEDTRRVDADLVGDVSLIDYNGSRYSSELTGSVAGRLGVTLIDDRLRWVVEDSLGQARQDLFAVPTPDNREQVNYFSTGPDVRIGLGAHSTALLVAGRYTRVDHETSPSDSWRLEGQIAIERELSAASRLGLYGGVEKIEPSGENPAEPYDRASGFLRYALSGARGTLVLDAGANRLGGEGDSRSGVLLRFEVARGVGRLSRLSFGMGQEFSDAGAVLRPPSIGQLPLPTHRTEALLQSIDPFTHRYVRLGWTVTGRRTSLGFALRGTDEDYRDTSLADRKRGEVSAALVRQLGVRTEASLGGSFSRNSFSAPLPDFDETSLNTALAWRLGRRLRIELSGERYDFSSDLPGSSVDETRYWFRLRYGDRLTRTFAP